MVYTVAYIVQINAWHLASTATSIQSLSGYPQAAITLFVMGDVFGALSVSFYSSSEKSTEHRWADPYDQRSDNLESVGPLLFKPGSAILPGGGLDMRLWCVLVFEIISSFKLITSSRIRFGRDERIKLYDNPLLE